MAGQLVHHPRVVCEVSVACVKGKPNGPPGLSLMLISVSVPDLLLLLVPHLQSIFPRGLFRLLTPRVYVMRIVRTKVVVQTRLCPWGRTQHYDDDGCQFGGVRRWR